MFLLIDLLPALIVSKPGTLQLSIEPELRTNLRRKKLLQGEPPEERLYDPEGVGMTLKKGDEVVDYFHFTCH